MSAVMARITPVLALLMVAILSSAATAITIISAAIIFTDGVSGRTILHLEEDFVAAAMDSGAGVIAERKRNSESRMTGITSLHILAIGNRESPG
jgi:hypothetical protein